MSIGIYRIINPKGRIYIGQSIDIKSRWRHYKCLDCKPQTKLYNSLKKYGFEKHIFEIIEECPESYLDELEYWWKLFYNSVEDGMNHSYYDYSPMRGKKHNVDTKQKIGEANKGKIRSDEIKLKMSLSMKGIKKSEESKVKMRNHPFKKSIIQYDLNNNFIREYFSISEAARVTGFNKLNISACLNYKSKTCGEFKWEFKGKPIRPEKIKKKKIMPQSAKDTISNSMKGKKHKLGKGIKIVEQYDLEGNFIKEWNGLIEIEKVLGFKSQSIQNNCKGLCKKSNGYIWKYKN